MKATDWATNEYCWQGVWRSEEWVGVSGWRSDEEIRKERRQNKNSTEMHDRYAVQ